VEKFIGCIPRYLVDQRGDRRVDRRDRGLDRRERRLIVEVGGGLKGGLIGGITGLILGLIFGLHFGLLVAVIVGLNRGGSAVIKHYALRLTLWLSGYTPFKFINFLDHCAKLIF
jgi:hypothetical protein